MLGDDDMVESIKRKVLVLLFLVMIYVPMHAISPAIKYVCTGLVAVGCAAGSHEIWDQMDEQINPFLLGVVGLYITYFTYSQLHKITVAGRLSRANVLLEDLYRHRLIRKFFNDERLFFDMLQEVYLTEDLPLVSAYNHLSSLVPTLHDAFDLINKASAQVGKNLILQEECNTALLQANELLKNIADAVKKIREHKDYLPQLHIYKEFLVNEKQILAQEQMAIAQLQMAHAQQSFTFLKWLKAIFGSK